MKRVVLSILLLHSFILCSWSRLLYRPKHNIRKILIDAIQKEKKRIRLSVYILSDKKITNALIEAVERGVEFDAIFDETTLESSFGKGEYLLSHGICFHCFQAGKRGFLKPLMHTKFIVFEDNENHEPMLFSGSCNFTQSGFERNVELLEQTNDPKRVTEFNGFFEYIKTLPTVKRIAPEDFL